MSEASDILARIDRLESLDEIRQLAAKYSLALDMRDLDALVNLFPEDVRVGRDNVGRAHFKQWMDETLRQQFTGTAHHIGNHIIEFESPGPGSRVGVFQERARDPYSRWRMRVGDHADAVLGSLHPAGRALAVSPAFALLLVRDGPQ